MWGCFSLVGAIMKTMKPVLLSFLSAGICLFVLCLFAYGQDAPEAWVSAVGRTSLFFGALMAGFLGGKSSNHFLGGFICTAIYLLMVLLASALIPATGVGIGEKWLLLGCALACGLLGSLIGGGRRRTKVVRRRHRARRA